jgi:hypothetical protein
MEASMNTQVRLLVHALVLVLGLALTVGGILTGKHDAGRCTIHHSTTITYASAVLGHFQPFLPPAPFYPLRIHSPTFSPQQRRHPAIPIPTILLRGGDDVLENAGFY